MDYYAMTLVWLVFHLVWSLGNTLLPHDRPSRLQYGRELLLQWNTHDPPADLEPINFDGLLVPVFRGIPGGRSHKIRKRGRRGGARLKLKKQSLSRIPLPSIMLSNVQSLWNKTDELQAQARYSHDFRNACLLAFTETWLSDRDSDADLETDGFGAPIRLDRDAAVTGKSSGGGVCLYINQRWCKSVTVREKLCTADIELLSVSLRPPYLPREFPQIFVTLVYIHPRANERNACEFIHQVTQRLQSISPDAPHIILGDMNHCTLKTTLRDFHQYITCPTRHNKILDLCYGNIKGAYKSIPLPPLGSSDHNCIQLIPVYRTVLKQGKVQNRRVKVWDDNACLTLQGCLEATDWDMFKESSTDIDELTDVVSSWVSYCENSVIPEKFVKIYPNSKPWISKTLKALLYKKKKAFKEGNRLILCNLQKEIKHEIRLCKRQYKEKIEGQLKTNNLGSAWDSMKMITRTKESSRKKVQLAGYNSDLELAQSLNDFYLRFDSCVFRDKHVEIRNSLVSAPPQSFLLAEDDVIKCFKKCKQKKSPGPDCISGRLLKT